MAGRPDAPAGGSNIRADLRVGPEFVETIAGLGVLKDIDVYPTLTGLVVLDGHRRHRAAIEAGLETVPVRIVDVANDLDRIGLQLTENDEHAHTSTVDRARAINQLVLMGLPAAELRKRGVRASEATLARRVANASQEVAALGESANLGLDDLAKIAEAEADLPEDIAGMVVEEIREAPGKIDHFLERARDEHAAARSMKTRSSTCASRVSTSLQMTNSMTVSRRPTSTCGTWSTNTATRLSRTTTAPAMRRMSR